jgi:hypothetical protein
MTDSINFTGTSLVNQADGANSGSIYHSPKGWLRWAQRFSGWRFESPIWNDPAIVKGWEPSGVLGTTRYFWGLNTGVSGQLIDQIWSRRAEIASAGGDYIFVDAGTNDMAAQTADYIHGKRVDLVDYFLSKGFKKVFILTILSRDTGVWTGDTREKFTKINRLTKEHFKSYDNVIVVDWNAPWIEFLSGSPKAGYSIDGTHFDAMGAFKVGKYIAENYINPFLPVRSPFTTGVDDIYSANNPYGNSMLNPYMQGVAGVFSGAASGVLADNYRVEISSGDASAVCAKVVDSTVSGGTAQSIIVTPGTTGESVIYLRTSTADLSHNYAGKWVRSGLGVRVKSANDTLLGITLSYDDTVTGIKAIDNSYVSGLVATSEAFDVYFQTPHLFMQNDSTTGRWRAEIVVDNTKSNDVEIEFYDAWLREVSSPLENLSAPPTDTVYTVSAGHSVTTINGIRNEGEQVSSVDFINGGTTLSELISKGFVE